jgi:hypothetical protein
MPVKKKQKVDTVATSTTTNNAPLRLPVKMQTDQIVTKLMDTLDTLESSDLTGTQSNSKSNSSSLLGDAATSLLQLKALQRQLLEQVQETQRTLDQQAQQRRQQELRLQNMAYQKTSCQHAIQVCQTVETPFLEKLASEELDNGNDAHEHEHEHGSTRNSSSSGDSIIQFLGADPSDPTHKPTIVQKLHQEIATKTQLETELKKTQHQAATLKQALATKRKLLQELPLKLQEVERASLPLQKFCQSKKIVTNKLSTQRRARLDLAKTLSKPLYTLYHQLESYIDAMESDSNEKNDNDSGDISLPKLKIIDNKAAVLLLIPIPVLSADGTSSTSSKKVATFQFEYHNQLDVVTAHAHNDHDMAHVIDELFPGDTGGFHGTVVETNEKLSGKPYSWCNYLAGLHFSPQEQEASKRYLSTRVILTSLTNRVRATATLGFLLNSLARKPQMIPLPASRKQFYENSSSNNNNNNNNSAAKLSAWTEQENTGKDRVRVFGATFKRKSSTLMVQVRVNMARYPAVPPECSFAQTNTQESYGQNHGSIQELLLQESASASISPLLFDAPLARLERHVHQNVSEFVNDEEETTYDWILTLQLAEIAKGWEDLLNRAEANA